MRLFLSAWLLGGVLFLSIPGTLLAEELHTAAEVRGLTVDQAKLQNPVKLRGVVTFFDEKLFSRFIQDDTAGIYLGGSNEPALESGQLVEVDGTASPGEYAPVIIPVHIRVLGKAPLPVPQPVTYEQLASGNEDSQFVEVSGTVRSVNLDPVSQYYLVEIVTGGGRLSVYTKTLPVEQPNKLVDSTVRVRGVCSTLFNNQRQLFAIRLLVPRPEDLVVESPAMNNPFAIPASPIGSLLGFAPQGTYGHRVKVAGTVIYQQPGQTLFVQDGQEGVKIESKQTTPLQYGDRVEALGFAAQGDYTPILQDAVYRKISSAIPPAAVRVTPNEALKGTHDCQLVKISAKLLEHAQNDREQFLMLEGDKFFFYAYLQADKDGENAFAGLENGSRVEVTGVCLVEPGEWQAGESWRAKSFRVLLRSPADVVILQSPPWWTLKRVLWFAGALVIISLAALTWVGVLRRRVQIQTGFIREQLQVEATLKERYLDLFENANDMVFTHDLSGRITSMNKAGERLLQCSRESVISRNLVDLIAEDQKAVARQWLEQVVKGNDLPTGEWDFINAVGNRVKLEISSRLIEQNGRSVEVEGVARDITERRRLERELLEISNREQRRIGHDLHDGVCQQLASIAYLVDILGDKLSEKNAAESVDAEKIGSLINTATMQARSVARGLFPVRLDENGLDSAIEEFATGTSNWYKMKCDFVCDCELPAVDNEVALHIYYITQEATLNAIRHGKSTHVRISLVPQNGHYKITIQDNGNGFKDLGASLTGMGIRIMRYRAKVIGANLELQSQPGHGSLLSCVFNPKSRDHILKS